MADYCEVQFSWETDKSPNYIIDYYLDSSDEGDRENCTSFPGKIELFKNAEDSDSHCELTVSCKPMYHVGITGITVVSESRNMEVYGKTEGYIQTVRGKTLLPVGDDENTKYFMSEYNAEEPLVSLTFKLLSLSSRLSFEVKRLQITLTQMAPPDSSSQLDIAKLKKHVEGMEEKVSDKAMSLLQTMEQYQMNQRGTMDDVRNMITQSSMPSEKGSSLSSMAGLLSMFSQMKRQPPTVPDSSKMDKSEFSDPKDLAGTLLSQMSSNQNGDSLHGEDMYKFLHSVCGRVSKHRDSRKQETPTVTVADRPTEDVTADESNPDANLASQAVVQEIIKQIQSSEDRIVGRIQKQMEQMEDRLNRKMDRLLKLLSDEEPDTRSLTSSISPRGIELD